MRWKKDLKEEDSKVEDSVNANWLIQFHTNPSHSFVYHSLGILNWQQGLSRTELSIPNRSISSSNFDNSGSSSVSPNLLGISIDECCRCPSSISPKVLGAAFTKTSPFRAYPAIDPPKETLLFLSELFPRALAAHLYEEEFGLLNSLPCFPHGIGLRSIKAKKGIDQKDDPLPVAVE
jgi:hypothetical protein